MFIYVAHHHSPRPRRLLYLLRRPLRPPPSRPFPSLRLRSLSLPRRKPPLLRLLLPRRRRLLIPPWKRSLLKRCGNMSLLISGYVLIIINLQFRSQRIPSPSRFLVVSPLVLVNCSNRGRRRKLSRRPRSRRRLPRSRSPPPSLL